MWIEMKGTPLPVFSALVIVLTLYAFTTNKPYAGKEASRPAKVQRYIEKYRYLSVELNQTTGIPTTIIIAVAGLESNWGTSDLARNANNHFGIKANDSWPGQAYCKSSTEYMDGIAVQTWECFRKYALIRKSYEDFGRFLLTRPNYKNLQYYPDWDNWSWAVGLQAGGYATDPKYAEKLMAAIEKYKLYEL